MSSNPASRQFYQLGELLRREGLLTEAVEVLRQGLVHHPRYVAAWVSMGRALLDLQELSQARQAFRQALDLDPQNPVAWRLLGEALLGLGIRSEALVAFEQALALVPGDEVLESAVASLKGEAPEFSPPPAAEAQKATSEVSQEAVSEPGSSGPVAGEVFFETQAELESSVAAPEPRFPEPWQEEGRSEPFTDLLSVPPPPPAEVFSFEFEDVFSPPKAEVAPFGEEAPLVPSPLAETAETPLSGNMAEAVTEMTVRSAEPPSRVAAKEPETSLGEAPPGKRSTLAEAREAINKRMPERALVILERLVEREPENQEAVDLLALVRDMLEPLPPEETRLSPRARKIAALQRFLAQLTLARERRDL